MAYFESIFGVFKMFEHSKLLAKGVNEAIKILESDVLSAEVETSELYSLENIFSAYSWFAKYRM